MVLFQILCELRFSLMRVNLRDKMIFNFKWVVGFLVIIPLSVHASIGPQPEKIHISDIRKTNVYYKEGLIVGGDQLMDQVLVTGVRHYEHKEFERITVELSGTHQGTVAAIPRPPYYQVALDPIQKRMVLTLFGKPITLQFKKDLFLESVQKKSKTIQAASLFPVLEKDRWSASFELKKVSKVEVFELKNPTRIVIDIQKESL